MIFQPKNSYLIKQIDSFNIARLHTQEDYNFQTRVRDLAQECLTLETDKAMISGRETKAAKKRVKDEDKE